MEACVGVTDKALESLNKHNTKCRWIEMLIASMVCTVMVTSGPFTFIIDVYPNKLIVKPLNTGYT